MTKKNLSLLVFVLAAVLPFVAACGDGGPTGPSPISTPTPVAQKMAVSITVNGAPVADGSTIHLAGGSNNSTAVCVTIDFPSAQGQYQYSQTWWNGDAGHMPNSESIPPTREAIGCGTRGDGASGSVGDFVVDATWFEANSTTDHQIKTVHVVFD